MVDKTKKEKTIIISILAVILLGFLIYTGLKFGIFSGLVVHEDPEIVEELKYYSYKQICSQDNSYFETLAKLAGGGSKKVKEIKLESIYCDTGEKKEIEKNDLDDLNCECLEREIRKCLDGWTLIGTYCHKGNKFTYSLKSCSFYRCDNNHYIEIEFGLKDE